MHVFATHLNRDRRLHTRDKVRQRRRDHRGGGRHNHVRPNGDGVRRARELIGKIERGRRHDGLVARRGGPGPASGGGVWRDDGDVRGRSRHKPPSQPKDPQTKDRKDQNAEYKAAQKPKRKV